MLLWDNYPVNDGVMAREMHLGAYRGRDAELSDVIDGVLCNPMVQPRASLVALATAAEYLRDPGAYDEQDAWSARSPTSADRSRRTFAPLRSGAWTDPCATRRRSSSGAALTRCHSISKATGLVKGSTTCSTASRVA